MPEAVLPDPLCRVRAVLFRRAASTGFATLRRLPRQMQRKGSKVARPLIGITAHRETARWRTWEASAVLLPDAYLAAVVDGGGTPVLLPPEDALAEDADDVLDRLDGLVLAGGPDIGAEQYGEEPHAATEPPRLQRDHTELALLRAALDHDVPVLGICRGMQLMAVARGGRLHQHLPDVLASRRHAPAPGVYGEHRVRFAEDSLAGRILGSDALVNTYHHQAVADPGTLRVAGWADDGTIESLEDASRVFALGVQWHPEHTTDRRLFQALVEAATVGPPTVQPAMVGGGTPSGAIPRVIDLRRH